MTDDVERALRVLSGLCPDCGKTLKEHTITCPTEHKNRIQKLKNFYVTKSLLYTLNNIKESKDV